MEFPVSKVQLVLYFTWAWAYCNVVVSKLFEQSIKLVMKLPDKWLQLTHYLNKPITSNNQRINILEARNENENCTNKFKLFLRCYWEQKSQNGLQDGFNYKTMANILNATVLYCTYQIIENAPIPAEKLCETIHKIFVYCDQNKNVRCSRDGNAAESVEYDNVTLEPPRRLDDQQENVRRLLSMLST
jgi:hypothetical protein